MGFITFKPPCAVTVFSFLSNHLEQIKAFWEGLLTLEINDWVSLENMAIFGHRCYFVGRIHALPSLN